MSDLLRRAREAKSTVDNESIPRWRRVTQALQAFAGLELTGLPVGRRRLLETNLVTINQILARYDLKTMEDWELMNETDLRRILDILDILVSQIVEEK